MIDKLWITASYLQFLFNKPKGTLGTGQRFTPKKRTVPVICFESEIDRLVYNLYGLTEEEIKIVEERE